MRMQWMASVLAVAVVAGCSQSPEAIPRMEGTLFTALSVSGGTHDVASMDIAVLPSGQSCAGTPIVKQNVALEDEILPGDRDAGQAAGTGHRFASAYFVLPPGEYLLCANPLTASGAPSSQCGSAQGVATVQAHSTSEVVLVSECTGTESGGTGVVVVLNDPPIIEGIEVTPSLFITHCESTTLTAVARDPDGDPMMYFWDVSAAPYGAKGYVTPAGVTATFSGDVVGTYEVGLIVWDIHGGTATLPIRIYVGECTTCVDTVTLEGTFTMSSITGDGTSNLTSILGNTNAWTAVLRGAALERYTGTDPTKTVHGTRLTASDFTFTFSGPDAALLNSEVAQQFSQGGLNGAFMEVEFDELTFRDIFYIWPPDTSDGVYFQVNSNGPYTIDVGGYPILAPTELVLGQTILFDRRGATDTNVAGFSGTLAVSELACR